MLTDNLHEFSLDNGLRVFIKPVHSAPVVTVFPWYRVGSRNERPGITGVSHWVEHMMFKGSPKFAKGEIFRKVSAAGGVNNAFTYYDFTAYFETLPANQLELGLLIEADRMCGAFFDEDEVASERTVIISEREGHENSPSFLLGELVQATAYTQHPYRWEVIGYKSDLEQMSRQDLYSYYKAHYAPNNCSLFIVGDVKIPDVEKAARHHFGDISHQVTVAPVRVKEPRQEGLRRCELRRPGNAPQLQMAYHIPAVEAQEMPALMILDAILSGAKSLSFGGGAPPGVRTSRLYQKLVRTGLCADASSYALFQIDPGMLHIFATPQGDTTLEAAENAISEEILRIQNDGVTERELEKAKKQLDVALAQAADGVTSIALTLGYFETIASLNLLRELPELLRRVGVRDVQDVARSYLCPINCTIGWFIPTKTGGGMTQAGQPVRHKLCFATGAQPLLKEKLANGMTIICAEAGETELLSICGSFPGGSFRDSEETAGRARMSARVASRGTLKRDFNTLYEDLDSRAATLGFENSLDRLNFAGAALPDDLEALLLALRECCEIPAFRADEVELFRGETLVDIALAEEDTAYAARRGLMETLYAYGHPYRPSALGTRESVTRLTVDDLKASYAKHTTPDGAICVICGRQAAEITLETARRTFADWCASPPPAGPETPRPSAAGLRNVRREMKEKFQTDICLGFPGIPRAHPDFYALDQATQIVGGMGLFGRLGNVVRDQKGLAYYVYASAPRELGPYPWTVRAGVAPDNVDRAIQLILAELKRMQDALVTDEENSQVKSYLSGILALKLETTQGLARFLHDVEYFGLGDDFRERYRDIIWSVSMEEIQRAAQQYWDLENLVISVAGP
jgi:zinc protease